MWHHRFRIRFAGSFPIDMLRYDGCYPETEQDSAVIEQSMKPIGDSAGLVHLVAIKDHRDWKPTADRWISFMARVENQDTSRRTGR